RATIARWNALVMRLYHFRARGNNPLPIQRGKLLHKTSMRGPIEPGEIWLETNHARISCLEIGHLKCRGQCFRRKSAVIQASNQITATLSPGPCRAIPIVHPPEELFVFLAPAPQAPNNNFK